MANVTNKNLEDIQVLAGSRRLGNRGGAAVRLDDLAGLLQMPMTLQSAKAAGATVTVDEFDALVDDVHEMHRRLLAIVDALRARYGRTNSPTAGA